MRASSPKAKKRATTAKTTTVTETTVKVTSSATISNTVFNNLMAEQRSNDDLKYQVQEGRNEIEHLKNTLIGLNDKLSVFNDLTNDVHQHKKMLKDNENARAKMQEEKVQTAKKILADTEEHKQFQDTLINDNNEIKKQMQNLKQEMARQQQQHVDEQQRQQQQHLQERENQRREHESHVTQLTNDHASKVNQLTNDHANKVTQLKDEQEQRDRAHIDELGRLKTSHASEMERQRIDWETRLNKHDQTIKLLTQTVKSLESTIISKDEIITKKQDVEQELFAAREHEAQMDAAKQELQNQLTAAGAYIVELEDKLSKQHQTSLDLLKALKDAEYQIETLKQYVIDLKSRIAVYIPVKDDAIDKKLAEYINNYPDRQKLKIMFMRESEGVYQFGTKRVAVKVEKDKINIRVGGGYLSLDEFLDQYTPAELEKLERKDPLKRFSEKVAVQKTIAGKERIENSPVRQRKTSPIKI